VESAGGLENNDYHNKIVMIYHRKLERVQNFNHDSSVDCLESQPSISIISVLNFKILRT